MVRQATDGPRERAIREALEGVAEELLALDPKKSGHLLIHFQNGIPLKVEWRLLARPLTTSRDR